MKNQLRELVIEAILRLQHDGEIPPDIMPEVQIDRSKDKRHGDFASNAALALAGRAGIQPRKLAVRIAETIATGGDIERVEVAGPGFINFFIAPTAFLKVIPEILSAGAAFGRSNVGQGRRVQLEFVSANPTGPLHVGHGRGAAYGAAVADLLTATGFNVHREYYVNDAGRQMDILAASVWLRYLELQGEAVVFPVNGYRGQYVIDIASKIRRDHGSALHLPYSEVIRDLPLDETSDGKGDKEAYIDALIVRAKGLLGIDRYRRIFDTALRSILDDIHDDLQEFGVTYEEWFSERSLTESGAVDDVVGRLKAGGHLYLKDGAWWFRSTTYGDEKDRVVIRENGQPTYFASDIAYHADKFDRGFEQVIDVWGADHHGYVPRIQAGLKALGYDAARLDVLLVQFASLYRGGEKVQMSTRSGQFVTLRELRDEVGNDAARFFYVLRKCEQHMDFDLDLAKSRSADNPVFYLQYAHARVCSVMRQLEEKGITGHLQQGLDHLDLLLEDHERQLISRLGLYPEVIETAALSHEPHQLAYYLRELANDFHTYYNAHQFLVETDSLRNARLALILATRQVLQNGLALLGVHAPESM